MDEERNPDDQMNRRNFLQAVGAGISLSAISISPEENEAQIGDITYNPETEVPFVAGWRNSIEDGEVVRDPTYEAVSIDKWNNMQATKDAIRKTGAKLRENFENADSHFSILESKEESSATGRRIDIALDEDAPYSLEELDELVPEYALGTTEGLDGGLDVPLGIKETSIGEQSHGCYDEPYPLYDDVPAAAPITATTVNEVGNVAGPFWNDGEGIGWVTNHHVVSDGSDPVGNIVNLLDGDHSDSGETIGEVTEAYEDHNGQIDIAHVLRTVSGKEPHEWIPRIDYSDNEEHAIVGVISDSKLSSEVGNSNWNLNAQGHASCRGVGYIGDVTYDTWGNVRGVIMDDDYTEDGDSGGVLYHYDGQDAHMCGVIVGPHKNTGHTYGTSAETTEDWLDGAWMTQ